MIEVQNFSHKLNRNKITSALSALAIAGGFGGCAEGKDTFDPIQVPYSAKYLGLSGNDSGGRYTKGPGKSFLIHVDDASRIHCGHQKTNAVMGVDGHYSPEKEVQVLSDAVAQVTCHGAGLNFPVEYFEGHRLPENFLIPAPSSEKNT